MPDASISDQPAMRTVDQLRDLDWAEPDAAEAMLDAVRNSVSGSEVMLPVEDEEGIVERVPYVHDGEGSLFRSDLKPAQVLLKAARRKQIEEAKRRG
jgi:hypothetical protein